MMKRFVFNWTVVIFLIGITFTSFSQTTDFESTLRNMKSSYNNDNVELVEHLIPQGMISKNDEYASYYFSTFRYFKIGGYHFVPVSIGHYGVCSDTYLISYTEKGDIKDDVLVGGGCDQPLDVTTFDYMEYSIIEDTIIEVKNFHVEPLDKERLNASDYDRMKEEQDLTLSIDYHIIRNGRFFKIMSGEQKHLEDFTISEMIWPNENLKNFNSRELRIKRNEIFARKGYKFKSKDLQDHFNKYDWYYPVIEDVSDIDLNAVELLNINRIKELEK